MDIKQIRERNLRKLVVEYRTQENLALEVGIGPGYLSQILSGHRNAGEAFCRKVEKALSLPVYYLDTPQDKHSHEIENFNAVFPLLPTAIQIALVSLTETIALSSESLSVTEKQLISSFRSCSKRGQKTLLEVAKAQSKQNKK